MNGIEKDIENSLLDVQICTLYSFENIDPAYWLTPWNIVWDTTTHRPIPISIFQYAYPVVYLRTQKHDGRSKVCLLHRIIAFARIANEPCECVEHLDDDPFNCRISNLLPSSMKANTYRSFINGHRDCPAAEFEVELRDKTIYRGTLKQISAETGIPQVTLYSRYYIGTFDQNKKYAQRNKITVLRVTKIKDAPEIKLLGHRFIDYRKRFGGKLIVHLDRLDVEIIK